MKPIPLNMTHIYVKISILKLLHTSWIMKFNDFILSKPVIIQNGWNIEEIILNTLPKLI